MRGEELDSGPLQKPLDIPMTDDRPTRTLSREPKPILPLLSSVSQVIDALGRKKVADLCQVSSDSAVSNYIRIGTFPATTYVAMTAALAEIGLQAPAQLWGMRE